MEPHSDALASDALAMHSAVRMAARAASGSSTAASVARARTPAGARRAREAQMVPQRAWTWLGLGFRSGSELPGSGEGAEVGFRIKVRTWG